MRTSALLSFVALTVAALSDAKQGKTVCSTAYCNLKGTHTSYIADQTSTVIKQAPPCYSTTTAYVTPKARVVTSIVPELSTTVVTAAQQTDVFTVTSISYAVTVPTTTTTVASTTPGVIVGTTMVPNPDPPASTTTTIYTAQSGPTPGGGARRRAEDSVLDKRSGRKASLGKNSSPALGKNIYCHQEFTETSTVSKPCRTFTSYQRLPQPTTTSTSTLTIPVTSTEVPKDATSIVTESTSSTITASTITFSYTYTANPTTTTVTSTAPLSTTTIVRNGYSDCNPNNYVNADLYTGYFDASETIDAPDAFGCCNAAAANAGAVVFSYAPGYCAYAEATSASDCPEPAGVFSGSGNTFTFGLLQCATR